MKTNVVTNKRYEIQGHKHKWANGIKVMVVGYNEKNGKIRCVREDLTTQKFELSERNLKIVG